MRVLIVKMSAMGDIIHGLPVAARLKDRLPGVEIGWLVEPLGLPLLQDNPAVDKLFVFEKRKWWQQLRSVSGAPGTAGEFSSFVKELRALRYDAVIDLQGLLKSSLLSFLSGARFRFGFKGTREGAEHLLTHRLDVGDYFGNDVHVVDLNLRLADFASKILINSISESQTAEPNVMAPLARAPFSDPIYGGVRFPLPSLSDNDLSDLNAKLDKSFGNSPGSPKSPQFVFIPGTTWSSKIWPVEKWVELGRLCREQLNAGIVLAGGPSELGMNAKISAGIGQGVLDLSGKTSILQLSELFRQSDLIVGADTGPLHLAAAVQGPPVLGVFGSTPVGRNGPYGPHCLTANLDLSCQPCFEKICPLGTLACLVDLPATLVFERANTLLERSRS